MSRILLVEDDVDVAQLLEHVLFSARYGVDRADSVTGACTFLERQSYDLVVADARLQDGTGMDVADRAAERGTKTLIITGYAFAYPELGRYDFLLKPIRPDELLVEVERVLGNF